MCTLFIHTFDVFKPMSHLEHHNQVNAIARQMYLRRNTVVPNHCAVAYRCGMRDHQGYSGKLYNMG